MSLENETDMLAEIEAEYTEFVGRKSIFLLLLALLSVALVGVATTLGVIELSITEVYAAIL